MSNIKYILLAIISIITLTFSYPIELGTTIADFVPFINLNILLFFVLGITFFLCYKKNDNTKISLIKKILCIIFSIFMIIGECFTNSNSLFIIFANIFNIFICILKLIGYYNIFHLGFIYLDKLLKKNSKKLNIQNKYLKKYISIFDKYPFRTSLITILIFWSIYLIAFYPIVLSPDPANQIKQYYNVPTKYIDGVIQRDENVFMTSHHPIAQTYLLGWCIDFGRIILNDNFGLFCYTIIQTLIYASILSYSIKYLKENIGSKYSLILLLIYLFVPMYGFYSVSAVKDTLYTSFMFLFIIITYDIVKNYQDNYISIKKIIILLITLILICLTRHNGYYVILITLPILLIYNRKNSIRLALVLFLLTSFLYTFNNVLIPYLGISDGSKREMLSVPFQQTARLVKYDEQVLSNKDKETIDKILEYDTLASRYNPELADPVKNKYNKYTTNEDLKDYFKIWYKGLIKRPDIYIDATLNNTYGYIYLNHHDWYLYSNYDKRVTDNNLVDYHYNNLTWLRNILTVYGNIFPYLPVIGIISSISFGTWCVLIISSYLITNNHKKYLITLIPLYVSILICFVSPANTYFRYAMPYLFPLPFLILLLKDEIKTKLNQ